MGLKPTRDGQIGPAMRISHIYSRLIDLNAAFDWLQKKRNITRLSRADWVPSIGYRAIHYGLYRDCIIYNLFTDVCFTNSCTKIWAQSRAVLTGLELVHSSHHVDWPVKRLANAPSTPFTIVLCLRVTRVLVMCSDITKAMLGVFYMYRWRPEYFK